MKTFLMILTASLMFIGCASNLAQSNNTLRTPNGSANQEIEKIALACVAERDFSGQCAELRDREINMMATDQTSKAIRCLKYGAAGNWSARDCTDINGLEPSTEATPSTPTQVAVEATTPNRAPSAGQTQLSVEGYGLPQPGQAAPVDPRMQAMPEELLAVARQQNLHFCSNDQVLAGGPITDRHVFVNMPIPGVAQLGLQPDANAQMVYGNGLVTWTIEPGPFALRFIIQDGADGEVMYFFSGVGNRLMRGGTLIRRGNGELCISPILRPNVGPRMITFYVPFTSPRSIDVQAFVARSGEPAEFVSACRFQVDAVLNRQMLLQTRWFQPIRVWDAQQNAWVNKPMCATAMR